MNPPPIPSKEWSPAVKALLQQSDVSGNAKLTAGERFVISKVRALTNQKEASPAKVDAILSAYETIKEDPFAGRLLNDAQWFIKLGAEVSDEQFAGLFQALAADEKKPSILHYSEEIARQIGWAAEHQWSLERTTFVAEKAIESLHSNKEGHVHDNLSRSLYLFEEIMKNLGEVSDEKFEAAAELVLRPDIDFSHVIYNDIPHRIGVMLQENADISDADFKNFLHAVSAKSHSHGNNGAREIGHYLEEGQEALKKGMKFFAENYTAPEAALTANGPEQKVQ